MSQAIITRSSLRANVVAGYLLQIAFYAIPLLTVPYLVLTLGSNAYGELAFAQVTMMFGVLFLDSGIDTVSSKELANKSPDDPRVATRFFAVMLIKAAGAAVIFALLCLYAAADGEHAALMFANYLLLLGSLTFPAWFFQGLEVMKYTLICGVAGRLLTAALLISLVNAPANLTLAAGIQASSTLLSGVLALYLLRSHFGIRADVSLRAICKDAKTTCRQAQSLFFAEFTDRACGNSPVFILAMFASPNIVGTFAAIEKFIRAGHSLVYPFQRAMFPRMCRDWQENRAAARDDLLQKVGWIFVLTLACAAFCYSLATEILVLAYGVAWQQHAWILQLLTLWLVLAAVNTYAGINGLVAAGRKGVYTRITMITAAIQLMLMFTGAAVVETAGLLAGLLCGEILRSTLIGRNLKLSA